MNPIFFRYQNSHAKPALTLTLHPNLKKSRDQSSPQFSLSHKVSLHSNHARKQFFHDTTCTSLLFAYGEFGAADDESRDAKLRTRGSNKRQIVCEVPPDEILLNASLGPLAREQAEPEPDLVRAWSEPGSPCIARKKCVGSASRSGGSGALSWPGSPLSWKQGPINLPTNNLITKLGLSTPILCVCGLWHFRLG